MLQILKKITSLINVDFMAVFFSIMIIANSTFEIDVNLYVVPKVLIFIFFVMMSVVIFLNIKNREPLYCKAIAFPVVFFAWETLSLIWSVDKSYSLFKWTTQAQIFLLFLFVYYYMRTKGSLKTFLTATYISGYALLFYTIYRYGLSYVLDAMSKSVRLGGLINNENIYGLVFASAILVAFYWITQKKSKLHIISIVLFTFFALSSGSKKAVVMIVAGIMGISILAYGFRRLWKVFLVLAILFAGIMIVVNTGLFPSIVDRFESFFSGNLNSGDRNREMFRQAGLELILKRPSLGYGLSSYAKVSGFGVYSHDNFIEIGVGNGVIGLILYYLPWVYSAVFMMRGFFEKKSDCLILFILIMLYIVMGVGYVQFDTRGVWILWAVSLALIDKEVNSTNAVKKITERDMKL